MSTKTTKPAPVMEAPKPTKESRESERLEAKKSVALRTITEQLGAGPRHLESLVKHAAKVSKLDLPACRDVLEKFILDTGKARRISGDYICLEELVGAAQTAPVSRPGRAPINKTGFVPDDKAQNSRPHRTVLYIQTQEGLSQREIEDALQVVEEIVNWHPAKDALSATQKQDLSDLRYKVAPDLKQDRSNLSHLKNQAEQELRTYEARLKKNPKISQDVKALEELWAEFCGACEKLQRHLNRHAGFWRGLKIHWERDKANEPEPDAREAILEAPEGQGDAETDLEDYDGPEEDLDAPEDAEDESLGLFDQNGAGQ